MHYNMFCPISFRFRFISLYMFFHKTLIPLKLFEIKSIRGMIVTSLKTQKR